jgi:two-component system response regulator HydG
MPNREPGRVLVVDDEQDTCCNLADILTDLGLRVDWACDGGSALELVRRNPYDVALLDLKMPGMHGLSLYREIKKLRAGTVALLVTAYAGGSTAEEALGAGAWRVVPKPVRIPALLGLVEEALAQPLVLVVDDDHDLCENLWQILRDRDFRVGLAYDGAGAEEELRDTSYDVVLIDMKLPVGNGSEVLRMVRGAQPRSRTVLITGSPAEMDPLIGRALAEGADGVCYKPFDVPELLEKVERLARAHPGRSGDGPDADRAP